MIRSELLLMVGVCALASAGCTTVGDDDGAVSAQFDAVTYNGGLAIGFVEAAVQRAPETIAQVVALDADVICVQEFWQPNHVTDLKAAATTYPNTVFLDPDPGTKGPPACTESDDASLDTLQTCLSDNGCDQVCGDQLVDCVLDNCFAEFGQVPTDCRGCLQASIGQELDVILSTCKSESVEFAFGGSFGIGTLSKHPITTQDSKVFDSSTNRRAVIYTEVNHPELGPVHAFCTHLTAVFDESVIPYPKATGSWAEEQQAQITEMLSYIAEKSGGGQVVLMGDMNTGPAGDGYIAEVAANYDMFTGDGFLNPYIAAAGHTCTYCGDNPIVSDGADDKESVVIDHVLTKGFVAGGSSRVIDGTLTVTSCEEELATAYSDHYGVRVSVTK